MKKITFNKVEFLLSAFEDKYFPKGLFDIAIVGRSNVGKSSLINHLLNKKKTAKVSQRPGKTQMINFFLIDDFFYLVDLPGYGFAKVSKKMKHQWSDKLDNYFENRKNLKLVVFLLDIRRIPNSDDLAFFDWATFNKIPILIVLTKTDKLKKHEIEKQKKVIQETLQFHDDKAFVPYTIKDQICNKTLTQKIQERLTK